jgi:hypothetical protein
MSTISDVVLPCGVEELDLLAELELEVVVLLLAEALLLENCARGTASPLA